MQTTDQPTESMRSESVARPSIAADRPIPRQHEPGAVERRHVGLAQVGMYFKVSQIPRTPIGRLMRKIQLQWK